MQLLSLVARLSNAVPLSSPWLTAVLPAIPPPAGSRVPPSISASGIGSIQVNATMLIVAPHKPTCRAMGCNSKRIRKGCENRICKAHCLEADGCSDPAHKKSTTMAIPNMTPALYTAIPLSATTHPAAPPLSTSPSHLDPRLRQSEVQMASPPLASSSKALVHTHSELAFASHMADIYTTQVALEEKMREAGRQMEATRLESKRQVQQTVFVYAWMEVSIYVLLTSLCSWFIGRCLAGSI